MGQLDGLVVSFTSCYGMVPAFERIRHFNNNVAVEGGPQKVSLLKGGSFNNTPVSFKNVSLTILGKKVLQGIEFEALGNDTVAIIGLPGSGKHSLANIMLAHYFPDHAAQGSNVLIYGSKVQDISELEIRKVINYLRGDPKLYTGTVRDNIDPDGQKTEEEIIDVLVELDLLDVLT